MQSFSSYMGNDHRRCDQLFANAEAAVESGDWDVACLAHQAFISTIQRHFAMEEETLFPAFEIASGNNMGPTSVMRHEHEQMRGLFEQMTQALEEKQMDDYLGSAETLLILMQQHNAKEEQILYPMTDQMLAAQQETLLQAMMAHSGD